jgi:hypothetical protein
MTRIMAGRSPRRLEHLRRHATEIPRGAAPFVQDAQMNTLREHLRLDEGKVFNEGDHLSIFDGSKDLCGSHPRIGTKMLNSPDVKPLVSALGIFRHHGVAS